MQVGQDIDVEDVEVVDGTSAIPRYGDFHKVNVSVDACKFQLSKHMITVSLRVLCVC